MPYYEFECDHCGSIHQRFYREIPRVDPMQIRMVCDNCSKDCTHKKIMSHNNFHLGEGGVGWAEDTYSGKENK